MKTVFNPICPPFDKVSDKVADISDISTNYLKLDASNSPLTGSLLTQSLFPNLTNTYDYGSTTKYLRGLYSNNSYIGGYDATAYSVLRKSDAFTAVWRRTSIAWVNNTTKAKITAGTTFSYTLLTTTYCIVGLETPFSEIYFDIASSTSVAPDLVWDYWNGSAWTQFSVAADTTNSLANTGVVTLPTLTGWASATPTQTLMNGYATAPDQTSRYYVRVRKSIGTVVFAANLIVPSSKNLFNYYANAGDTSPIISLNLAGNLLSQKVNLDPVTNITYNLGTASSYYLNAYLQTMYTSATSAWTGLAIPYSIGSSTAGTMATSAQLTVLPTSTLMSTDSGGVIFGSWIERQCNRTVFTNSAQGGQMDFGAISGRMVVSDENLGYNSNVVGLNFNSYIMKDYSFSPAGTFYVTTGGAFQQGAQSWFSVPAKLRRGRAFAGQGYIGGLAYTVVAEYIASFVALNSAPTSNIKIPNEFMYYAEKPTNGTRNWQFYGYGTGTGTGLFLGGEMNFAELIIDAKNITPTASYTVTLGANWAFVTDKFTHTAGSTAALTWANALLTAGTIKNGKTYSVTYRVTGQTAGTITPKIGTATGVVEYDSAGGWGAGLTYSQTDGNFNAQITANADNVDLTLNPSTDFDGSISVVSCVLVGGFNHSRVYANGASDLRMVVDINGTETLRFETNATGIGFFATAPVAKASAMTARGTYTLNTGDAGSDTEITLMRTRINQLEDKLKAYGLLT